MCFAAERPPLEEPILALDGDGDGPVDHMCVPSNTCPTYAPPGAALVSASITGRPAGGDAGLERSVRRQLRSWFGPDVDAWRHLRTIRIIHGVPACEPGGERRDRPLEHGGVVVCGDHLDSPSINGALRSGRLAAEHVIVEQREHVRA
jgi:hypothetical protein